MTHTRDPVSELFDDGARGFLERVYARPGQWVGTRIGGPTPGQVALFAAQGINVLGTDQWGRDRWAAGFVRSVYYQHQWHYARGRFQAQRRTAPNDGRALRYELGRRMKALGVIPAGRAVRFLSKPGGQAAVNAAARIPASRRIFTADGEPGPRWADPADRDWD